MKFFKVLFVILLLIPIQKTESKLFNDLDIKDKNFEAVYNLEKKGIINGFSDNTFRKDKNITRVAALKIILMSINNNNFNENITKSPFPDVPVDEWFTKYVTKGKELGIVKGDDKGNFIPSRNVSKAEALAMLYRSNKINIKNTISKKSFDDVENFAWFAPYFGQAKKDGLIVGKNAEPQKKLTRGELSQLTYDFFKNDWNQNKMIGRASYYSDKFEGNLTSNGEFFSNEKFTVAHRDLPFNTKLKVTNKDNLKQVIVRVNDRGPFAKNKIIDLSQSAFKRIGNLSQGVVNVSLEVVDDNQVLGPMVNCEEINISQLVAPKGLELSKNLNSYFLKNEYINIKGKVKNPTKTIAFVYEKNGKKFFNYGEINNNSFNISVLFQHEGSLKSYFMTDSGILGESFFVNIEDKKCIKESLTENINDFKNFKYIINNNDVSFSWSNKENKIYRLDFYQNDEIKTVFVNKNDYLILNSSYFENFENGLVKLVMYSADSNGSSYYHENNWKKIYEDRFIFTENIKDEKELTYNLTKNFTYNVNKKFSFEAKTDDKPFKSIFIADDFENIEEIKIENKKQHKETFTPSKKGGYIIEFVNSNDEAVLIFRIFSEGVLPLLKDPYSNIDQKIKSVHPNNEIIVNLVNKEREKRGLNILASTKNLNDLAIFRARDMCDKNYIGHKDKTEKTALDYRIVYNVKTNIAENIGLANSIIDVHNNLMRSIAHRQNIINKDFSNIGIGLCKKNEQLLVVQIFGSEEYHDEDIDKWRNKIIKKVNDSRKINPLITSETLHSIAQQWSNTMSKEGFIDFKNENNNLNQVLINSGVKQNVSAGVFKTKDISYFFNMINNNKIISAENGNDFFEFEDGFKKIGIGISQSEIWDLYITILIAE